MALCKRHQQVEIAQDPVGLGCDGDRVARLETFFKHLAGDPVARLDWLVRVGVGPHGQWRRSVFWPGKGFPQQFGGIGLGKQLGFEVEPRGQVVIGVGRAREAIDAAVFAAAVGIERAVECDIG